MHMFTNTRAFLYTSTIFNTYDHIIIIIIILIIIIMLILIIIIIIIYININNNNNNNNNTDLWMGICKYVCELFTARRCEMLKQWHVLICFQTPNCHMQHHTNMHMHHAISLLHYVIWGMRSQPQLFSGNVNSN